jgi:thiol-disulfide isomerase/thioredoxin
MKGKELKEKVARYGLLLAIAGIVPLRSGVLLLMEKECGCFLVEKTTLHANNLVFGWMSIAVGAALLLGGVWLSRDNVSKTWVLAFLLAGGIAGYTAGLAPSFAVEEEAGGYDELAQNLTAQGWVMFYANWCPRCHEQMEMLGGAVGRLRLIDCDTINCPSFVESYPTWARMRDGELEVRAGVQSIQELRAMAGG